MPAIDAGEQMTDHTERRQVLIVDDQEDIRELLTSALEDTGLSTRSAADFFAACQILETEPVDLLVTDLIMPGATGLELIASVRSKTPSMKILAISGGGRVHDPRFLELGEKLGADVTMQKPIDLDKFAATVLDLVRQNGG